MVSLAHTLQLTKKFDGVRDWLNFVEEKLDFILRDFGSLTPNNVQNFRKLYANLDVKIAEKLEPILGTIALKVSQIETNISKKLND